MQATFICPACRQSVSAPSSLQGEAYPCPKCNAAVTSLPAPVGESGKVRAVPPSTEPADWHYSVKGNRRGPVAASQLKSLVESGVLRETDLVWKEGMPEWVEARRLTGLFPNEALAPPAFTPSSPPPAYREDEEEDRRPRRRRDERGGFRCLHCGSRQRPIIKRQISPAGWIVFALLLIFTIFLCFIGLFIKEDVRVCRDCGARLT